MKAHLSLVEILYDVIVESFFPFCAGLAGVLPLLLLHIGRPLWERTVQNERKEGKKSGKLESQIESIVVSEQCSKFEYIYTEAVLLQVD